MTTLRPTKQSSISSVKLSDKRFRRSYARLLQVILDMDRRRRFIHMVKKTYGEDQTPNSLILKTLVVAKFMPE